MVSSSLIRSLLADGKVRDAAMCLGRPYVLIGEVVEGEYDVIGADALLQFACLGELV